MVFIVQLGIDFPYTLLNFSGNLYQHSLWTSSPAPPLSWKNPEDDDFICLIFLSCFRSSPAIVMPKVCYKVQIKFLLRTLIRYYRLFLTRINGTQFVSKLVLQPGAADIRPRLLPESMVWNTLEMPLSDWSRLYPLAKMLFFVLFCKRHE